MEWRMDQMESFQEWTKTPTKTEGASKYCSNFVDHNGFQVHNLNLKSTRLLTSLGELSLGSYLSYLNKLAVFSV